MAADPRAKAFASDRSRRYRARKRGEDVPKRRPGPTVDRLPSAVEYDAGRGSLTVDGVTFNLEMLRDFIAALTPGARLGPYFLQRTGDAIEFRSLDLLDVRIIHRCQAAPSH